MGQDSLTSCKETIEISNQEIVLMKQQLAAQDDYIKQLRQQRDAAMSRADKASSPGLLHDLSCGMVGAAAGIVLIRGFR